jgi:hypothetical protein
MTKVKEQTPEPTMRGRITHPFKLKFKAGHDTISFHLKELFKFIPETIVIMCTGHNEFKLFGQFTPEQQKLEDLVLKNEQKKPSAKEEKPLLN